MTCVGSWCCPSVSIAPSAPLLSASLCQYDDVFQGPRPSAVTDLREEVWHMQIESSLNRFSLTRSKGSAAPLMMLSDAVWCGSDPPPGQSCSSTKVLWRSCGTLGRARSRQRPLRAPLRAGVLHHLSLASVSYSRHQQVTQYFLLLPVSVSSLLLRHSRLPGSTSVPA